MLPVNAPYLRLYLFCSDQYIVSAGGAVALNLLAVDKAMDYFEIDLEERSDFYEKVRTVAAKVLNLQHKEAETKRRAAQKK